MITKEDREREPFRWCVYCDTDCEVDEPEHADDCPDRTGIFPVTERDLGPRCVHCGEGSHGPPQCSRCGVEMNVGSRYMHAESDIDLGDAFGVDAPTYELVCVGCAAHEAIDEAAR